jgi:hypothetical protein
VWSSGPPHSHTARSHARTCCRGQSWLTNRPRRAKRPAARDSAHVSTTASSSLKTRRVYHPARIRAAEPPKQKHDRRNARLLLDVLAENRFPSIWMPSTEQRDLRTLLRHRHHWEQMLTRVQRTLQSMTLAIGLRLGTTSLEPSRLDPRDGKGQSCVPFDLRRLLVQIARVHDVVPTRRTQSDAPKSSWRFIEDHRICLDS